MFLENGFVICSKSIQGIRKKGKPKKKLKITAQADDIG
jgi:hypothetical protein